MGSAVFISGAKCISDDGSTLNAGDSKMAMPGATGPGSGLFDLGDADMCLVINGTTFETHKFLIKKFAGLKNQIKNGIVTMEVGAPGEEDFRNTFKILYASIVEGPFDFDSSTLNSALLLATRYDFPALRTFAIDKLEKVTLSAVERIRLAREFDIPSWEEPAYLELCERDEAITMSEARVLGLETVVHVARIREKEQRRRGKEIDATEGATFGGDGVPSGKTGAIDVPVIPIDLEEVPEEFAQATNTPASTSNLQEDKNNETRTEANCTEGAEALPKPCFINTPMLSDSELASYRFHSIGRGYEIDLPVPDCNCAVLLAPTTNDGLPSRTPCKCKLPPCAVSAFKDLQTRQLAHKSNISGLEITVEQIQAAVTSLQSMVEHSTETVQHEPIVSNTLKSDVQRWLVRQRGGAAIV